MTLLEPCDRAESVPSGGRRLLSRTPWGQSSQAGPLQVLAPDPSDGPCAERPALMLPAPQWVPSQRSPPCSECRI